MFVLLLVFVLLFVLDLVVLLEQHEYRLRQVTATHSPEPPRKDSP